MNGLELSYPYRDVRVKICIITYRRPVLLERALRSLITQTHQNWVAEILNDDPEDIRVADLVREIADPRISISKPMIKRGGTGNFNEAFKQVDCAFAGMLEDDNWYETGFLEVMLKALAEHPEVDLAVANERIWLEGNDGNWTDSKRTVWPVDDSRSLYDYDFAAKCGSAKICNSSMLWRTERSSNWLTPADLPIDVTEHFRERLLPHPILVVNKPLVNFAQTVHTNRSNGIIWSTYQVLLIASVFTVINTTDRKMLAEELWSRVRDSRPLFSTTLLHTALSDRNAFILIKIAPSSYVAKYILTWIRRPISCFKIIRARHRYPEHWRFLLRHSDAHDAVL